MKTIFQYAVVIALFSSSCTMAGSINERQSSQQDRIKQGVHSGELTSKRSSHIGSAASQNSPKRSPLQI